ncbi:MAG: aldehyde dehydrogenase [Streptosporangiaceae bacterium]
MTTLETSTDQPQYQLVIDGRRVEAASGQRYDTVDPYLGAPWASAADGGAADVDAAVAAARRALAGPWGQLTGFGRARLMRRLAELITRDAPRLAEIETRDTGKLLREMGGQLGAIPEWLYYFSGLADKIEGSTIPGDKPNFLVYTRREPAGVVAAIVPWNSPLLLLCWKLAPALAAGCTMVAKPSDYSPASAVELATLMDEAGFPPGVFNVVTGFGPAVGRALAAHPGIDKIAFTGSTLVGAEVAKAAAANITGVLLELGGKSAHLVFDDADLDAACNGVLAGVFAATGQTCMAGSRLLVSRGVHDALVDKIAERARSIRLGDPRAAETEMGPVATEPQYRKVLSFLQAAAGEGATVAAGGRADDALGGYFVQPTVLTNVKPTMTVACEEVFGPVLSVIGFDTEDEAIALANDSRYGLAGAVWTKDIHRGHRVAHAMRAGTVWINAYRIVGPDVPFGGFGLSGLGRENGIEAVHEYTQTKAIWVELTGGTRDPFTLG